MPLFSYPFQSVNEVRSYLLQGNPYSKKRKLMKSLWDAGEISGFHCLLGYLCWTITVFYLRNFRYFFKSQTFGFTAITNGLLFQVIFAYSVSFCLHYVTELKWSVSLQLTIITLALPIEYISEHGVVTWMYGYHINFLSHRKINKFF